MSDVWNKSYAIGNKHEHRTEVYGQFCLSISHFNVALEQYNGL